MKMIRALLVMLVCWSAPTWAQDVSCEPVFNDYFMDGTLRIDYTFSGDVNNQEISLDKLNSIPRWYGKRYRLDEVPVEGNGQIWVADHHTHQIIYRNSFSTLFQEWLSYEEAQTVRRSFENVFLVPMPKDTVDITVALMNNRREIMTKFTHTVVPTDILIRKTGNHMVSPYETLQQAADTNRCIHIAFVAEGYQEEEMPVFLKDAQVAIDALFAHEPFKSMRDRFNIIAVKSPSKESGTSEVERVNHLKESGKKQPSTHTSTLSIVTGI